MKDVITIGDATEDVFVQLTEATVKKKGQRQELCMEFGTKLPLANVDKLVGGNAMNVAVGCARLGLDAAFYVELGNDAQGERIKNILKKEKVDTRYVFQRNKETNYSVVLNVGAERTLLVYHVARKYTLPKLESASWCYYSSLSPSFYPQHTALLKWIKKYDIKVAFNPGSFHLRKGTKALAPLLKRLTVLFLNKEEAQLFVKSKSNSVMTLARKLSALGPKYVVITDGANGSYAFDGKKLFFQDIYPVPVVERTGCGDSYATGFTVAFLKNCSFIEAMQWGTLSAASVLQHTGPQQGLTTLTWIKKNLKSKKLPKPKEVKQ